MDRALLVQRLEAPAHAREHVAQHLEATGVLLIYGAVFLPGEPHPAGNATFDRELRERDPAFGVRTLDELRQLATSTGLAKPTVRRMTKNNVLLRFGRA